MFNDATSIADAKRDAAAYLATMGPAVHGAGGDHHTYRAACVVVRDFGLPLDDGLDVLRVWNQSCQPPWSERQLRSKLRSAMRSGRHAVGAKLRKRLDADAAYDHVLYAIFTWAPDDERARALAALDRAVKWTGAMRKVPALERQAALFLALFEPAASSAGLGASAGSLSAQERSTSAALAAT